MMNIFSLDALQTQMDGKGVQGMIYKSCQTMKEYNEDEIYFFYPKNILSEEAEGYNINFELTSFLENKVIIASLNKDKRIKLKSYFYKDICGLEFASTKYEYSSLIIKFSNTEQLVLNSDIDCNQYFRRDFVSNIGEIYKYLIK